MNAPANLPKKPLITRVRRALAAWFGGTLATSNEWLGYWTTSATAAGQTVSEANILKLSAAWACTRLISESIGSLPLHLYEKTDDGRRKATEHPLYYVLHQSPNPSQTSGQLWEAKTAACLLRGNGFSEILRVGGRPVGLNYLAPSRLRLQKESSGALSFIYTMENGQTRTIPSANIFHVPGFTLDGHYGVSAIQYGAGVFGSAMAAQNAANNTFDKGLMPTSAFTFDKVLTGEQRTDFKTYAEGISGALNAGEAVVIEGGMGYQQVGINPNDAQLLESRGFSVEEVCRWFRVDPSLVGHTEKSTSWGTGLEQKMLHFLMFTLRIWLVRIEQAINLQLLTPTERRKYYAEFAIEGLLRGDSASRAAFYQIMVQNGILTRDEVRMLENLPPMGGNADVLTVNAATVALDEMASGSQNGVQLTQAVALTEFMQRNNGAENENIGN